MYLKEIAFAALLAVYTTAGQAQEGENLRESLIVTTASESILASAALVGDYFDGPVDSLEFSGSYTDSSWDMVISGSYQEQSVEISMSGFLFGSAGSDFDANYSGTGLVNGEEPILVHGNFSWDYNSEIKDYESVSVSHAMRFGENSVWGWVVGGEIVFGGALFGGAAIIGAPATGGGSLVIGGQAAIRGAGAAVLLSKHARDGHLDF